MFMVTYIHVPGKIRTRNHRKRAATGLRLRPGSAGIRTAVRPGCSIVNIPTEISLLLPYPCHFMIHYILPLDTLVRAYLFAYAVPTSAPVTNNVKIL